MWSPFLRCKIHRAIVTDANVEYEGSISIGSNLLEASGLRLFEKVEIYNVTNGNRFATYVMPAPAGEIAINGAAAWKAGKGDIIIIANYVFLSPEEAGRHKPALVYVNNRNEVLSVRSEPPV
jgi:aspartate 1-decarboxylase